MLLSKGCPWRAGGVEDGVAEGRGSGGAWPRVPSDRGHEAQLKLSTVEKLYITLPLDRLFVLKYAPI